MKQKRMSIGFTQYLRPDGRTRAVEIEMPAEVEALAAHFVAAGGRFECEELRTGEASFTAVFRVEGEIQDIAIEVVPNGPPVVDAVERLVRRATAWLEERLPL